MLIQQLLESNKPLLTEIEYYFREGCGSFAYALWLAQGKPSNGQLGLISDKNGEKWSERIPFEITHIFYINESTTFDAFGERTVSVMANQFGLSSGHYMVNHGSPDMFRKKYMGMSDTYPIYFDKKMVKDAMELISKYPEFYKL